MSSMLGAACASGGGAELEESLRAHDERADDGAGDELPSTCGTEYARWLIETFDPLVQSEIHDGCWDEIVATAPRVEEICGGWDGFSTDDLDGAYETWHHFFSERFVVPYMLAYNAAASDYYVPTSDVHGDHALFVERVAVTENARRAAEALLLVKPPRTSGFLHGFRWLGAYSTWLREMTRPLPTELYTLYASEEDEWTINASEAEFLSLLERAAPEAIDDGAFGEWLGDYRSLFIHGTQVSAAESYYDCFTLRIGETQCRRDVVLERFAKTSPGAHGELDSRAWMSELWLTLTLAEGGGDERAVANLARIEAVAPEHLVGESAYVKWLELYEERLDDAQSIAAHLAPVKPCAITEGALDAYDAFFERSVEADAELVALAAPAACN